MVIARLHRGLHPLTARIPVIHVMTAHADIHDPRRRTRRCLAYALLQRACKALARPFADICIRLGRFITLLIHKRHDDRTAGVTGRGSKATSDLPVWAVGYRTTRALTVTASPAPVGGGAKQLPNAPPRKSPRWTASVPGFVRGLLTGGRGSVGLVCVVGCLSRLLL